MKATYLGNSQVSTEQVNWGSNDDPRGVLVDGQEYEVLKKEVHSWHTKLILEDYPNLYFNSVHFDIKE